MGKIKKYPIYSDVDVFGDSVIVGYSAPSKGIEIRVCDKREADKIVIAHHYSHKPTKNSFMSFLVYHWGGDKRSDADRIWNQTEDKGSYGFRLYT